MKILNKPLLTDILVSFSLPLMVLVVAPTTICLGNEDGCPEEFKIILGFIVVFLIANAIIFSVLRVANLNASIHRIATGIILGLSFTVWVQSQLLVWSFGPLDGRGLMWENFSNESDIEKAIWIILIPMIVFFCFKKKTFVRLLIVAIPLLGFSSMAVTYFTPSVTINSPLAGKFKTIQETFTFHKHNNTIVLVLDTYQSDAFQEILDRYPDETDFLDGFQFFPDAVAGYPTTKYSIPSILTGKLYKNEFPYITVNQIKFYENWIGKYFQEKNYGVTGDFGYINTGSDVEVFSSPAIRVFQLFGLTAGQISFFERGFFRAAPIVIKARIYDQGQWTFSKFLFGLVNKDAPPEPHFGDWLFARAFKAQANNSSDNAGEFKFFHLMGAHDPLSLNENYQYIENIENTREGYLNQARGVLKLTRGLIEKLKELDIYDNAEILIVADHGAKLKPIDMQGNESDFEIPVVHIGSARPLFLYKKPNAARERLKINNIPMHLAYIPCLLSRSGTTGCDEYDKVMLGESVIRHHYHYSWDDNFWFTDFAPSMRLYEVNGDSRNFSSWKNSSRSFAEGKEFITNGYSVGEMIDFGKSGRSNEYIVNGWSSQEAAYRWTEGNRAKLRFRLKDMPSRNLQLQATICGFSPDGESPQNISIQANGIPVGSWDILGKQTINAMIPRVAFKSGELTLYFMIEKPTSPYELDQSSDTRKLGLCLFNITLLG